MENELGYIAEANLILLQMHVQGGTIIADDDESTQYLIDAGLIRASERDIFGAMVYVYTDEGKRLSAAITEAGIVCS